MVHYGIDRMTLMQGGKHRKKIYSGKELSAEDQIIASMSFGSSDWDIDERVDTFIRSHSHGSACVPDVHDMIPLMHDIEGVQDTLELNALTQDAMNAWGL